MAYLQAGTGTVANNGFSCIGNLTKCRLWSRKLSFWRRMCHAFPHGFFHVYSLRAFPLSFCFSFLGPPDFHLRGKTGLAACLFRIVRSSFRLLAGEDRRFCGHWKIAFSRMKNHSAENDSGKCRMGAKDILFAWLFVNVRLPVARRIRFLQRCRTGRLLSLCRCFIPFPDILLAGPGIRGWP